MSDDNAAVDDVLEALAGNKIELQEAKRQLKGVHQIDEFARIDARQGERTGIPEVVEAERKTDQQTIDIGHELLSTTGRAIVTGVSDTVREELSDSAATAQFYERSQTFVGHTADFEQPDHNGTVGVVTAGTSDITIAEQAVALSEEMGCTVERLYDVGVSGVHRLLAEQETLTDCDCVIAAAGREGALATVVAGMVSAPVIGLPVGTGSGYAGDGEAALLGMLQSCTYLTVVNIDAGFVAGGQAALIAR
jgi:NCAIR mutase (PurE)-related proteins